jgi:replicative DNA helicase
MDKSDKGESEELPRWSEMLKRVMSVGLGAAFMTEESIRNYLGEMPKEVVSNIIQSANKSKSELLDRVGNEVIRLIQKIDFVKEASRFVEEHKFKVTAEIDVVKKEKP